MWKKLGFFDFVAVLTVPLLMYSTTNIAPSQANAVGQCTNSSYRNENLMEIISIMSRIEDITHNLSHIRNINCTNVMQRSGPRHRNLVSSCPWNHTLDRNHDRIPQDLRPARCMCSSCRIGNELGVCSPVVKEQSVFIRRCESGEYKFYRRSEFIPIACVCVPYQV